MQLKALEEKRAELLTQIEEENKSETRSIEKIDELIKEVDEVNASIEKEKEIEARLLDLNNGGKKVEKKLEKRDFNAEIRAAIVDGKELDITGFEVRNDGMGVGELQGNVISSTQDIAKHTFASAILKKASEVSDLYKYVRKENFGSALHQIPVQTKKISQFENVKELAEYEKDVMVFSPIQMSAHKYGAVSIVSEECLSDTGYNIMSELLEQYGEAAGETLDRLIVLGDDLTGVEGLETFVDAAGDGVDDTEVVKVDAAGSTDQEQLLNKLMELYNALPRKYAKNGTWVVSPGIAAILNTAVDGVGRPLLYTDFTGVPFGGQATPMLLGRPVVVTDSVQDLGTAVATNSIAFFGDLNKALVSGVRQNFTIKTSTEVGFMNDSVAVKGTMRLDVKRALSEAMAVLVRE